MDLHNLKKQVFVTQWNCPLFVEGIKIQIDYIRDGSY